MSAIRITENVILKGQVIMISVSTIVSWAAYRFILDTNLLEANLGDLKTLKKKKNFVNVVSNTNQIVLFLPAQNLKLWKRTLLPPSAFLRTNLRECGLWAISKLAWVTILSVLKWIHLSSDTTTSKCYFSESFYTCSIVHPF